MASIALSFAGKEEEEEEKIDLTEREGGKAQLSQEVNVKVSRPNRRLSRYNQPERNAAAAAIGFR